MEEVELWVTCKGMDPFLLPPHKARACLLVPSVNQNLAKQGLIINRVVWERREFGRPVARLQFFPQHKQCKHSNTFFQKPAGVHLGYMVMKSVIEPTREVTSGDLMVSSSAGSGAESSNDSGSAPSTINEDTDSSPQLVSGEHYSAQLPIVSQATTSSLTGPNLESGQESEPECESEPASSEEEIYPSYSLPTSDYWLCGPVPSLATQPATV